MPKFDTCSSHKYFYHIIHICIHLCLFFQLSWSCHAAVLPARWTNCPSHWRLQSRRLHGDVPWVTQLQGADALPGHHVSTSLSPRIYTLEAPLTLLKTVVISQCSQLCFVTFLCGWRIKRLFTANVDQYWLKTCSDFQCKLSYLSSYCSPEYTFPRQQEVINFAASTAFELVTLNPRTLVVCGSYSVGKEKVFLGECVIKSLNIHFPH